ncbi:MAG: phage tail tape measure protein [Peptostreptococcaceae bacterium]
MSKTAEQINIELAMDANHFEKAVASANKAIKNLDSEFRSSTKSIDNIDTSFVGLASKLDNLNSKIDLNKRKLEAQESSYDKLSSTLTTQKKKLQELEETKGKSSEEWKKQSQLVIENTDKLSRLETQMGNTKNEIGRLESELGKTEQAFTDLSTKTETAETKLKNIDNKAELTESEFKRLSTELKNSGTSFQQLSNNMDQISSKLDTSKSKLSIYSNEIDKLKSSLDTSKSTFYELEHQIDRVETNLSNAKSKFGENSVEVKNLQQTLNGLKDEYNSLDKEIKENETALDKYQTQSNNTKAEISRLESELGKTEQAFNDLATKTETAETKLEKIDNKAELTESEFRRLSTELQNSGTYFQQLGNDMDQISSKLDTSKSKLDVYSTEIDNLKTSLDKSKTSFNDLETEIQQTEQKLASAKSEFGDNSTEAKDLERSLNSLKDNYNSLDKEIAESERALQSYETQANNTQAEINELSRELAEMPFDRIGSSLKSTGDTIKGVGQNLLPVTTAVTGLGTAALITGTNFESSMSGVQATLGATKEEVEVLKDKALELGSTTSFSASQVADAFGYMALAGYDNQQMLDSINPLLDLARAGNMELASASDLVTDSMSAMGKETGELSEYLDMVAMTSTKSNTSVEMLMDAFIQTGGMAKTLGIDTAELSSTLGIMANAGFKGSEAGNALSTILTRLANPTTEAAAGLDALGITVFDTEGNFMGLENVLGQLNVAFEDLTAEEQAYYAKNIAGQNFLGQFIEIVDQADGTMQDLTATVRDSNGSLEVMSATMGDNLQGKIDGMKSALEGSLLAAFELLIPVFEQVIGKITDLANWFTNLDESTQSNIITIAGIAGAVGPVLILFGTLASSLGSIISLAGTLQTGVVGVSGAFTGVGAVLGPLASAALPLLGAAFIGLAAVIGDNSNMLNFLQDKFGSFGTVLSGVCEFISGVVQITFGNILSWVQLAVDAMAAVIDGPGGKTIEDAWKNHNERLEKNVQEGMEKITLSSTKSISHMKSATDDELKGISNSFDAVLGEIPNIADGHYSDAATNIAKSLDGMSSSQLTVLKGMNDTTKSAFKGITEDMDIEKTTKAVESNLSKMAEDGEIDVKELEKGINEAMELIKKNMDEKTEDGANAVNENLTDMTNNADKNLTQFESIVDSKTQEAKDSSNSNTKEASDLVNSNLTDMTNSADQNLAQFESIVDSKTQEAKNVSNSNTKELSDNIDTNTKNASDKAKTNLDNAAKEVEKSTAKMSSDAKKNTGEVATNTDTDFKKANQSIQQSSTDMYNGARVSFQKLTDIAKQEGTEMYLGVKVSAEKMASSAKESASDMYRGVTTSTAQMAQKAISDWNSIRNAYANPITASISVSRTETTTKQVITAPASAIGVMDTMGIDDNQHLMRNPVPIENLSSLMLSNDDYQIDNSQGSLISKLDNLMKKLSSNTDININLNIENFNNNRKNDVEQLMEEITSITKRKNILGG